VELDADEKARSELTVERRPDAVHLYGSWLASRSTAQVMAHFALFGPSHVEWIDDVRLNVVFGDHESAVRCLMQTSVVANAQHTSNVQEEMKTHGVTVAAGEEEFYVWRNAFASKPPNETMLLRLATVRDVKKPISERKPSQFYEERYGARVRRGDRSGPKLLKVVTADDRRRHQQTRRNDVADRYFDGSGGKRSARREDRVARRDRKPYDRDRQRNELSERDSDEGANGGNEIARVDVEARSTERNRAASAVFSSDTLAELTAFAQSSERRSPVRVSSTIATDDSHASFAITTPST